MTAIEPEIAAMILRHTSAIAMPETEDDFAAFRAFPIAETRMDSLDSMELIMEIEDRFAISLDEDAVLECRTLGDLIALTR
ncbi:acyl carrier protein, partial [Oceanicola sp. S124]|uniref:acyl carrier protein n=1 Tax=Oceanicola sp. S124 TaxID=1042378 RepID=UPI00025590B6